MLALLLHDPQRYVAKTLDESIQKLAKLNEMYPLDNRWGMNIYEASKDLEPKYQEDFIRYLGNPAMFDPDNEQAQLSAALEAQVAEDIPEHGRNTIDPNYTQRYELVPSKNGRDFDVVVTNAGEIEYDDEKNPQ